MSEVVNYNEEPHKIGTCENLYYVTYEEYKAAYLKGQLSFQEGNLPPADYLKPDSGFRFRFPFPDEDNPNFGKYTGDFHRGVPITMEQAAFEHADVEGKTYEMQITQQKLIHRQSDEKLCLALVWRDKNGASFRVEDDTDIKSILQQIVKHHIVDNSDPVNKAFYKQIAVRLLKGYRLPPPEQKQQLRTSPQFKVKTQQRRGRGI